MSEKVFEGKYTLEQLRQNLVLLQASEIEIPRMWILELIILAQESEQLKSENTQLQSEVKELNDSMKRLYELMLTDDDKMILIKEVEAENTQLQSNITAQKIVIDEWIRENEKLKEVLKTGLNAIYDFIGVQHAKDNGFNIDEYSKVVEKLLK